MKVIFIGREPSALYAAILLQARGFDCQVVYSHAVPLSLRPLSLEVPVLRRIRRLLRQSPKGLQKADLAQQLIQLGGPQSTETQFENLAQVAQAFGVRLEGAERLPAPDYHLNAARALSVLAARPQEYIHWPSTFERPDFKGIFFSSQALYRLSSDEASRFMQKHLPFGALGRIEGVRLSIEPLSCGKNFVLSLYAKSRYRLERAKEALCEPKAYAPMPLKSLCASSHLEKELELREPFFGPKGYLSPLPLRLGPGFYSCTWHHAQQSVAYFRQAERLYLLLQAARLRSYSWQQLQEYWLANEKKRVALSTFSARVWAEIYEKRQDWICRRAPESRPIGILRKYLNYPL